MSFEVWKPIINASQDIPGSGQVVALSNGNILVAWTDRENVNTTSAGSDVFGRLFDAGGIPIGPQFQINTVFNADEEFLLDIAATSDGGYIILLHDVDGDPETVDENDGTAIRFERYDANGTRLFEGTIASGITGVDYVSNASIALNDDDSFVVAFHRGSSTGNNFTRGVVVDSAGAVAVPEFTAGSNSDERLETAVTILSNGNIVVINSDNVGQTKNKFTILDPGGIIIREPQVLSNPGPLVNMENPHVEALPDGGFVTMEMRAGEMGFYPIVRVYEADGAPRSGRVNLPTGISSDLLVLPDGTFVVLFLRGGEGGPYLLEQFSSDGNSIGRHNLTNLFATDQYSLAIDRTADGRLLLQGIARDPLEPDVPTLGILDLRDGGIVVNGTSGADGLTAPVQGGTVNGLAGADVIYGHDRDDVLNPGGGVDKVRADSGNDTVTDTDGINGDDLHGQGGIDTIDYRGSNYANGAVTINLATGRATSLFTSNVDLIAGFENVEGSNRGETVVERFGANIIRLNGGNDRLVLNNDAIDGDVFDGGAGNDTFDLSGRNWTTGAIRVDLGAGTWSRNGASEAVTGFENISGGNGTVGEALTGSSGDNRIDGNGANDIIRGAEGSDTLDGGTGDDTFDHFAADVVAGESIDGGTGNDTIQMSSTGVHRFDLLQISSVERIASIDFSAVQRIAQFNAAQFGNGGMALAATIDGNSQAGARDVVRIAMNGQTVFSAAAFAFTDWGADNDLVHVQGGAAGESITGSSAIDLIEGNAGNDILRGGGGRDTLRGGNDDDRIVIEAPGDSVAGEVYDGGTGRDRLEIAGQGITDLTAASISSIEAIGFIGEQKGTREAIFSAVQFAAGAIDFGSVVESDSTEHADILTVDLAGRGSLDLSQLSFGVWGAGGDLVRVIGSSGADVITGSVVADEIMAGDDDDSVNGGNGNDTLRGGGGHDDLTGGRGKDRMTGNAGNDTFIFNTAADSPSAVAGDHITDFVQGTDLVDISGLQFFDFIGDDAFAGAGQSQLRYTKSAANGITRVQGDVNGDGTAEFVVTFTGLITFQVSDFLF